MEYHELERYSYINSNDFQNYEFYSDGPKGWIKKIVMFTKIPNSVPQIYNLGFGDQDPNSGKTDDVVVNNNEDRDIVLATVANTIIEFCNHYGNHYIYAKGSTTARTRLYQMGIAVCERKLARVLMCMN